MKSRDAEECDHAVAALPIPVRFIIYCFILTFAHEEKLAYAASLVKALLTGVWVGVKQEFKEYGDASGDIRSSFKRSGRQPLTMRETAARTLIKPS